MKFEYKQGIIAALAVLEVSSPQDPETNASDKDETPGPQNDVRVPVKAGQYIRKQALDCVKAHVGYSLGAFAAFGFLWRAGFISMNLQISGVSTSCTILAVIFSITQPPKSNAVTGDLGRARRYLNSQGLFLAGLGIFLPYMMTFVVMALIARLDLEPRFPVYIVSKLALGLLLTNLHTAWVHTVISKSDKSIWQRIPGRKDWLAIVPVASLDILLPDGVFYLTQTALVFFQGISSVEENASPATSGVFAVAIVPILLSWWTATFTRAIYVKVAASMLPIDDQTVLPFDHKGPTNRLNIRDAIHGITMQNWHLYLRIVHEVAIYEYLWVSFSVTVIVVELHYMAPCAVIDILGWYTRDW